MRGPPMGAPKMPPRRWWQAVIAPHDPMSHTRDTQHVAHKTMVEATASHHLRGAIWVGHHHALPACRHDPAWRNTGLRTAATPRGVANYLASCYRPPRTAPATQVGEIRGMGNVRLLSSFRRQRRVRAEALAPGCSQPHHRSTSSLLTHNLRCPAAPWAQKKCAILAGGTLLWETKLFY